MSSIGLAHATVVRKPRVRLVITGNELLPTGSAPHDFQITDANGPMLAALAERDGAIVDFPGLVRDDADAIRAALHADADIVIVSGGSSVGIEDLAPIARGRAWRAGRARHRDAAEQPDRHGPHRRAADLPAAGQPGLGALRVRLLRRPRDSCARRPAERLAISMRCARRWRARSARRSDGSTTRASDSRHGRVEPLSVSGASVLSSTTRADGFVIVDEDSEGYAAGSEVTVWLYA